MEKDFTYKNERALLKHLLTFIMPTQTKMAGQCTFFTSPLLLSLKGSQLGFQFHQFSYLSTAW